MGSQHIGAQGRLANGHRGGASTSECKGGWQIGGLGEPAALTGRRETAGGPP